MGELGYRCLLLSAFTASWSGVAFAGLQPVDLFIAIAMAFALLDCMRSGIPRVPAWLLFGSAGLTTAIVLRALWPVSQEGRIVLRDASGRASVSASHLTVGMQWFVALSALPFLAMLLLRAKPHRVVRTAYAYALGASASALVACSDFLNVTHVSSQLIAVSGSGRQAGLTSQANNLGIASAIALPILLHFSAGGRLRSVGVLTLAGGAIASGSRAGQGAFLIGLLLSVGLGSERLRSLAPRLLVSLGVSVAVATILLPGAVARVGALLRFLPSGGAQQSDAGRELLRHQAFQDWLDHPVAGIGLNVISGSHLLALQVLAAGGLLLLVPLMAYLVGALRATPPAGVDSTQVLPALRIAIVVWLSAALVSNQATDRYLYFPIALIAALTAKERVSDRRIPVRSLAAHAEA